MDIQVLDVNDNAPQFTQKIYSADIRPDHPVSAHVSTVSATDRDVGLNARITYLLADDDNTYFQVWPDWPLYASSYVSVLCDYSDIVGEVDGEDCIGQQSGGDGAGVVLGAVVE